MENSYEFQPFDKIARLKRELVITEKLDGTNAQVVITYEAPPLEMEDFVIAHDADTSMWMLAGSRKRFIAPEGTIFKDGVQVKGTDNFGFAQWVCVNQKDLWSLGEGRHYGEWYGQGIQRGYGLGEKRFALFNVARWGVHNPNTPACCEVVPKIAKEPGEFHTDPDEAMHQLNQCGSQHVPGFYEPEGIVVWHSASRTLYKQTFDMDGGKWREEVEYDV